MAPREYTPMELDQSKDALSRSEDDLLLELGKALTLVEDYRDGDPGDPDQLRGRANNWFERNFDELKKRVCGHENVHHTADGVIDVAAVADLIAGITGKPAAFTVAAIIVKRGLRWLCS